MARRGENIRQRKDGRWEGRYIKGRAPDGRALYGSVYAKGYLEVCTKPLRGGSRSQTLCSADYWDRKTRTGLPKSMGFLYNQMERFIRINCKGVFSWRSNQ